MAIDSKLVQLDPRNALDKAFSDNRDYSVVTTRLLPARLLDGWKVEQDVDGADGERLILVSRRKK